MIARLLALAAALTLGPASGASAQAQPGGETYCSQPLHLTISATGRSYAYVYSCGPINARVNYKMKRVTDGQSAETPLGFNNWVRPLVLTDEPAMWWVAERGNDKIDLLGALEVWEWRGAAAQPTRVARQALEPNEMIREVERGGDCAIIRVSAYPKNPAHKLYLYSPARGLTKAPVEIQGRIEFWDEAAKAFVFREWDEINVISQTRYGAITCDGRLVPSALGELILTFGDGKTDPKFAGAERSPRLLVTRREGERTVVSVYEIAGKAGGPAKARLVSSRRWDDFLRSAHLSADGRHVTLEFHDRALLLTADDLVQTAALDTRFSLAGVGEIKGDLATLTEDGLKITSTRSGR